MNKKLRSNSSIEYINEKKQKFEPYIKFCVDKNPLSSWGYAMVFHWLSLLVSPVLFEYQTINFFILDL